MIQGTFLQWREKRGSGWSETKYSGIEVVLGGQCCIISKLSHGLRVLKKKEDDYYLFENTPISVELSESFVQDALHAFEVDKKFQSRLAEYETIISSV